MSEKQSTIDSLVDDLVAIIDKYNALGVDLCGFTKVFSTLMLRFNIMSLGSMEKAVSHVAGHLDEAHELIVEHGLVRDRSKMN